MKRFILSAALALSAVPAHAADPTEAVQFFYNDPGSELSTENRDRFVGKAKEMAIERTFSMIKPDATKRNLTGAITKMLEDAGLRVVASKRVWMSLREAQGFYAVHKDRPFFGELTEFMSSGPTDRSGSRRRKRHCQEPRSDGRHQPGQRR
jgi:hypothetical protein